MEGNKLIAQLLSFIIHNECQNPDFREKKKCLI